MAESLDIHCIAIGGTGMAPLACLLKQAGHRVRGSDGPLYPPMSTLLSAAGIEPYGTFSAQHLHPLPDLVVVGNAVPSSNPEALEMERLGLPRMSMPEALGRFFLAARTPLVVAGTHGKTTTSSLAAYVYETVGADPGYLLGGLPLDLEASFRRGRGARFIVEGDEYNAAYFDRGPKFLHYRPQTLILTSVEYDHADLYPDEAALEDAYRALIAELPTSGLLVACGDSPTVRALAQEAGCRRRFYGLSPGCDIRAEEVATLPTGTRVRLRDEEGEVTLRLRLFGEHNVQNALAVWAVARADDLPAGEVSSSLGRFRGVRRRLEELGESAGVVVVDDFAHHPTEVAKSLDAARQRYPRRRLVALFEPRSLTAGRSFFFDAYRSAFAAADRVLFAPVFHHRRLDARDRLDLEELCRVLAAEGTPATCFPSIDALLDAARSQSLDGDVAVAMSSGSFEELPRRLLRSLEAE